MFNIILNQSEAAKGLFAKLPAQELYQMIERIYLVFDRSPDISEVLSHEYYAPYLLVQLVDKQTFLKSKGDHTLFRQCLQNTTTFELEELSKMPEIEERFVKFLKYIEILSSSDPSKQEGQKLISLIFSIDKYKAYQNVSLQLFDQESMIYEEEAPMNNLRHTLK